MSLRKKVAHGAIASNGNGTSFPPEAFAFDADVTPESVAEIRERARPEIEGEEWELIDGFASVVPTVDKPAAVGV